MEILDGVDNLEEEAASFSFFETLLGYDVFEEFSTWSELHNEIQLDFTLNNLTLN